MSRQLDQVSQAAMSLTPEERAELAEPIWQRVTAEEQASITQAWCTGVDRRIARAEERGTPGISAEQVLSDVEADLHHCAPAKESLLKLFVQLADPLVDAIWNA